MLDDVIAHDKEYKYVGFWTRFGASFIDGLILIPLNLAYFLVLIDPVLIWAAFLCTLLAIIYKPALEISRGSTWGKDALGIKVLRVDGEPIGVEEGLKRWLLPFGLSGLMSLLAVGAIAMVLDSEQNYGLMELLGKMQNREGALNMMNWTTSLISLVFGISIAMDASSRGLHDKIGGTMVVYKA